MVSPPLTPPSGCMHLSILQVRDVDDVNLLFSVLVARCQIVSPVGTDEDVDEGALVTLHPADNILAAGESKPNLIPVPVTFWLSMTDLSVGSSPVSTPLKKINS